MRERIREGPILIQGSGRVNFPHFLRASDKPGVRTCACAYSRWVGNAVLAPSYSFLLLIQIGSSVELQTVPWADDPIGNQREGKEGRWRGSV